MLFNINFNGQDISKETPQTKNFSALVCAQSVTEAIANLAESVEKKKELGIQMGQVSSATRTRVEKVYFTPSGAGDFFRIRTVVKTDDDKNELELLVFQANDACDATSKAKELYDEQGIGYTVTNVTRTSQIIVPDLVTEQGEVLE